jgi:hypothetical protein
MEKKDFFEENIKNFIFSHGEELKMDEEQKKKIIEQLITKSTDGQIQEISHFYNFRKLAIAAAVVIVPAVLAVYFLLSSDKKITIPPELASMSVEQLIKLNYDKSQNTFDPNIVKYALKQALEKTDPQEVIKIAKNQNTGGGMMAERLASTIQPLGDSIGYSRMPFPEIVEASNLFVHARLLSCDLNVEDIIAALIEKERNIRVEDYMSKYKVTIQLYVIDSLPKNLLKKGKTITIPTVLYEDQLNSIKKNSDYYFAMAQNKGQEPKFLEAFSGVYPVDFNKPANIEMWQFFKDAQDVLLYGQNPKPETINYWVSKLKGDTFALAIEYMNILPDDLLPSKSLMDAIEQKYNDLLTQAQKSIDEALASENPNKQRFAYTEAARLSYSDMPLFIKAINLLLRSKDKESIKIMLALLEEDIQLGNTSILWRRVSESNNVLLPLIIKMIVASDDKNRSKLLLDTYEKYKNMPLVTQYTGSNNAAMLRLERSLFVNKLYNELLNEAEKMPLQEARPYLESILKEPSKFGFPSDYSSDDSQRLKRVWNILASGGDSGIRSYLENIIGEPNYYNIGINPSSYREKSTFSLEQSAFEALLSLPDSARPEHKEMIRFLLMIYERNKENESCKNFTVNTMGDILESGDSECIPFLTQMLLVDKPQWSIPNIIAQRIPDQSFVPAIRQAIRNKKFDGSGEAALIEALYACEQKDEAVTKVLEVFAEPFKEDTTRNLLNDLRYRSSMILFLGKTQRTDLIPLIKKYTEKEYEKYRDLPADLEGRLIGYTLNDLMQNSIMALARLGGKSSILRLREIYKTTGDVREKAVSAIGLYYNGDRTGEKYLDYFVEGTHLNVPEIRMRWGVDISEGTLFQNVIKSYLCNELTDALWLEKLQYYVDRADTDTESGFFKDHRKEILNNMVEHLNHKNRSVRGYASEILQKATGQNFGFEADRYAGQQDDIIHRWREYFKSEQE